MTAMQLEQDRDVTVTINSRLRWLMVCVAYVTIYIAILATVVLPRLNQTTVLSFPYGGSHRTGYPRFLIDGLESTFTPPNSAALDYEYWGHLHQSESSKEIATALGTEFDRVFLENNTIVFFDTSASVLHFRSGKSEFDNRYPSHIDLRNEFERQLLDSSSLLRNTTVGTSIVDSATSALNVTEISEDIGLGYVIYASYYSIRSFSRKMLPGESASKYAPYATDSLYLNNIVPVAVWMGILCVFLPFGMVFMATKLPSKCIRCCGCRTQESSFNTAPKVHVLFFLSLTVCSMFAGFVAYGIRGTFDFEANWAVDPPQLYYEHRPMMWAIAFSCILLELLFCKLLNIMFACCCGPCCKDDSLSDDDDQVIKD